MTPEAIGYMVLRVIQGLVIVYAIVVLGRYGRSVIPEYFETVAVLYIVQVLILVTTTFEIQRDFNPSVRDWTWLLNDFVIPLLLTKILISRVRQINRWKTWR